MENEEQKPKDISGIITEAEGQFDECSTGMTNIRKGHGYSWDEREELFFGGYYRTSPEGNRERYMDSTGELTTLAIDRASRVVSQLPSGRFENLSGDTGKNLLMNLLFEHYVLPNGGKGVPVLSVLRTANLYSDLYTIPVLVEWSSDEFYTGPKFVVINPRRFYPQPGKESIGDMEYCFVDTFVSKGWLKTRDDKFFKNIPAILQKGVNTGPSAEELSPSDRINTQSGIRIRHRFTQSGEWLAWSPDAKLELVYEKKWFPRIPIALKQQYPRIGSLWSYTNFERGHATQVKIDSLSASNLRAVEMMIDPPVILDPIDAILSSFKRKKGATWFVKNGKTDSIKFPPIAPQALAAFSESYQVLKANLLSMSASTDTAVTAKTDPGFGKSPEALKQQASRLGARDAWDQDSMKMFVEDLFSIAADEIATLGVDKYSFTLMKDAIERIQEDYPEENLQEFFTGNTFSVEKDRVSGRYRYQMEPGSTLMKDEDTAETILALLKIYAENPKIEAELAASGQKLDYGAAFRMILREKGSKFAKKIIVAAKTEPEGTDGVGDDGATVTPPENVQQPAMQQETTPL